VIDIRPKLGSRTILLYIISISTTSSNLVRACSLPRVQPHYAVKCNPNAAIIATLAAAGASFDCASQHV
jgi:diaminopimelate decarboxylase